MTKRSLLVIAVCAVLATAAFAQVPKDRITLDMYLD